MKLAFTSWRCGHLKSTAPVIAASLARGHQVVLVGRRGQGVIEKPGEAVGPLIRLFPGAIERFWWPATQSLADVISDCDVLVGPSVARTLGDAMIPPAVDRGPYSLVPTVSLDYCWETITDTAVAVNVAAATCYTSAHQRDLHRFLLGGVGRAEDQDQSLHVVGSTQMDHLALVDRADVRKRLGASSGQPIVAFFALKMAVPDPWRRLVWGRWPAALRAAAAVASGNVGLLPYILRGNGYLHLMRSLRSACDSAGALLVVKSRPKNCDPPWVRDLADVYLDDDGLSLYPYLSMELLAVADVAVHFQSGAALEAAFAGVPQMSIAVPQPHLESYQGHAEVYGLKPGSMQAFYNVVWPLEPKHLDRLAWDDMLMIRKLYDPERRRQYVEKFLGFDDAKSGERVMDVVEAIP